MTPTRQRNRGFTLIELLTVIAIIAILSAILVPTVGQFRTLAKKTSDVNDLRSIVQSSQMYAAQNGENFVGLGDRIEGGVILRDGTTNDLTDVAAVLALDTGLNEPGVWVSENESSKTPDGSIVTTGTTPAKVIGDDPTVFSFDYVAGLTTFASSRTPLVFSRKETLSNPRWEDDDVYGDKGGHIAFVGGNVSWYESLTGELVTEDGSVANNIQEALGTDLSGGSIAIRGSTPPSSP